MRLHATLAAPMTREAATMASPRPGDVPRRTVARALTLAGRMLLLTGAGVFAAFALFSTDAGARDLGRLIGLVVALPGLPALAVGWWWAKPRPAR